MQSLKNFFSGSKVSYKLLWMVIVFLIPTAVLTWIVVSRSTSEIAFARGELEVGVPYFNAIRQTAVHAVAHRRAAHEQGLKSNLQKSVLSDLQSKVEGGLKLVAAAEAKAGANPNTPEAFKKVNDAWAKVKSSVDDVAKDDRRAAFLETHDPFVTSLSDLMVKAADVSKLTLDPEVSSYALHIWVQRAVAQANQISRAQAIAATAAVDGALSADDRDAYMRLASLTEATASEFDAIYEDMSKQYPKIAEKLKKDHESLSAARVAFVQRFTNDVLNAKKVEANLAALHDDAARTIAAAFNVYDAAEPPLREELVRRMGSHRADIWIGLSAIGVGLTLVFAVVYFITRSVTRQTNELTNLFVNIGIGNFGARANVTSNDEIGAVATNLNAMLDNTLALIQSREERDQIQQSIGYLLQEVAGVAEGDLTKEAKVTEDVTGAIADSFNYMIDQLRKVIGNVQSATKQVSTSASEVHNSAEHLAQGAESQAEQIVNTSAAIDEMAVSIQQVSENAAMSASVAQQALANARQGNDAVQNTVKGMGKIRDQVQETAKRIKRLGESSQEIGSIVQLIDDIADRTSILALNASIQAAAAGEAGRGFAVVAEEVERLAVRSTDATKKIATLVKSIQGETNEAVAAMEKGIQEVVEGSKLANSAGGALQEIEGVSQKLAELIQSISLASKQQARGSEALAKSMNEISQITQQTAAGTKQAAVSVDSLSKLAEDLRGSVSTFRLPEGYGEGSIGKKGKLAHA